MASMNLEDARWTIGAAIWPTLALLAGLAGIWFFGQRIWGAYETRDPRFWTYFYNTIYLMIGTPFSIAGSLALALLLNDELPLGGPRKRILGALLCLALGGVTLVTIWGMGHSDAAVLASTLWVLAALGFAFNVLAFRTIFYLPTFTAGVALMILWKALYSPQSGPINIGLESLMHAIGFSTLKGPEWLSSLTWSKPALIIMGLWTYIGGLNMLLYLAALSNVPPELLNAAEVDGANRWQCFRHVTWPQLAPTTFFITIMSVIWGLQGGFEQARVMTNGGPGGSTTTLSFYIYLKAFQDLDLGYAAAISWIMFAIIFIATAINWKLGKDV